ADAEALARQAGKIGATHLKVPSLVAIATWLGRHSGDSRRSAGVIVIKLQASRAEAILPTAHIHRQSVNLRGIDRFRKSLRNTYVVGCAVGNATARAQRH